METGSAMALTLASAVGLLPQALLGLFAGVLIDRFDRKLVMIIADLAVALSSLLLALGFMFGFRSLSLVYLVLFVRALGETFHKPALQAAIPQLVPSSELTKAGGLGQLVSSLCTMAGPMLGALLMSLSSLQIVLLTDFGGAIIAVAILRRIKLPKHGRQPDQPASLTADLKQGLAAFASNRILLRLSVPLLLTTMLFVPVGTFLPLIIKEIFDGGAWHNGLAQTLFSVGMLVSALLIGLTGGLKKLFHMISLAIGTLGICAAVTGLLATQHYWLFCMISFVIGASGMGFNIPFTSYIQSSVPTRNLGKVIALVSSVMSLAAPAGMFIAGPLAGIFGLRVWLLLSGVCMLGLGLTCYLLTRGLEIQRDSAMAAAG